MKPTHLRSHKSKAAAVSIIEHLFMGDFWYKLEFPITDNLSIIIDKFILPIFR